MIEGLVERAPAGRELLRDRLAIRALLDHGLDAAQLTDLFGWSEQAWSERTAGSALRRPGYLGWLRNLAIALGNAPTSAAVTEALSARAGHPSELVREHVAWALGQHASRGA